MYTDTVHARAEKRFKFVPSLEAICLFCAAGLAVAALVIPLLPRETLDWVLNHIG